MTKQELVDMLRAGTLVVKFIKADGSLREMRATLQEGMLPAQSVTAPTREPNPQLVHVWDLDKGQWRSVRLDRLQEVRVEHDMLNTIAGSHP